MIEIDGSQKSGSGTILRLSVALAAITNQPLHIYNIRQSRPQPGLKPQHLEAVITASKLCCAKVQGASLGSRELWFTPQQIRGGSIEAVIETAGSIPMLLLAVMPICLFADSPINLHVAKGGTDTTHAPTINYLRHVLLPTLARMGVDAEITVQKYGYYPKGMGEATLAIKPNRALRPIIMESFGKLKRVGGVSVCTFLADRQVAERQAKTVQEYLSRNGLKPIFKSSMMSRTPSRRVAQSFCGLKPTMVSIMGADAIGQLHKTAEAVGLEAAEKLVVRAECEANCRCFLG